MRILEIRRHSMRHTPGAHLTAEGVILAARAGSGSGPFHQVITSTLPRAAETAVAMGQNVDRTIEELGNLPGDVFAGLQWPAPFAKVAQIVAGGGACARFATQQAQLWARIAEQLPASQRALIVTHGGFVELGAIGCLPGADHSSWGGAIGYCEGVKLSWDGSGFTQCEMLRMPRAHQLIEN
jgi:broad specificity phosphatase PhoE